MPTFEEYNSTTASKKKRRRLWSENKSKPTAQEQKATAKPKKLVDVQDSPTIPEATKEIQQVIKKATNPTPESSNTGSKTELQLLKEQYELKLKLLEEENKDLKSTKTTSIARKLKKNEEKLLNAIRTEKILQKTESPLISRIRIMKEYGINSKYLDQSIKGLLLELKIIKREKVKYDVSSSTYKWTIIT